MTVEIIDAQVHESTVQAGELRGSAHPDDPAITTELMLAAMDAVGVHAALITSCRAAFSDYACRTFPDRFRYLGEVEPDSEALDRQLGALADDPDAAGIRVRLASPPQRRLVDPPPARIEQLRDGGFEELFRLAGHYRLPAALYASGYLPDVAGIARRHEGLTLVLDHLGILQPIATFDPPSEIDSPPFRRLPELLDLAQFPNVAVKLTGVPTLSSKPYPFRDLLEPVEQILEAFGPSRVVWGSDIQRVRRQARFSGAGGDQSFSASGRASIPGIHTYSESLDYIRHSPRFDETTKRAVLGASARTLFRWDRN